MYRRRWRIWVVCDGGLDTAIVIPVSVKYEFGCAIFKHSTYSDNGDRTDDSSSS
jgi:hypothetical protein